MIFRTIPPLRAEIAAWKAAGERIGLVPTMGALHEGHLSLVNEARKTCQRVIVSIFVNPRQFNNPSDLALYPRTEEEDVALLSGTDAVFIPSVETMYPAGYCTAMHVGGLSTRLEGAHRPGHFDGMATVVTKLFTITGADCAFFGEKDWQQLQIVRRLVADLALPIEIIGCPTLRERDGLALSSRNRRLTPQAREIAPQLHSIMQETANSIRQGTPINEALNTGLSALKNAGFAPIDYLDCCHAETLEPAEKNNDPLRLMAAAALDTVRLIDNIVI